MKIEVEFIPDVFEELPDITSSDDDWFEIGGAVTGFDIDTFWQSLWVIHDLAHEALSILPSGELGITVTSPSNKSLRYLVKRV